MSAVRQRQNAGSRAARNALPALLARAREANRLETKLYDALALGHGLVHERAALQERRKELLESNTKLADALATSESEALRLTLSCHAHEQQHDEFARRCMRYAAAAQNNKGDFDEDGILAAVRAEEAEKLGKEGGQ